MSIKEIAKRAQVSPATVSRVLNNPDYKCSSPQIRERIRKAAIHTSCKSISRSGAENSGEVSATCWTGNVWKSTSVTVIRRHAAESQYCQRTCDQTEASAS